MSGASQPTAAQLVAAGQIAQMRHIDADTIATRLYAVDPGRASAPPITTSHRLVGESI